MASIEPLNFAEPVDTPRGIERVIVHQYDQDPNNARDLIARRVAASTPR